MTIKELISKLSKYDMDRCVVGLNEHGDERLIQIFESDDPDDPNPKVFVSVD